MTEMQLRSIVAKLFIDAMGAEHKSLYNGTIGIWKFYWQKMMLEHFSKVTPYFYKIIMSKKDGEDISGPVIELKEKFDLVKKKTKFFGGDSITKIDYMMWPWFERLEAFDLKQYWYSSMWEDPAVKVSSSSTENYKAFFKSAFIDGKPDYVFGL
uniref:GST C-terminal domain-containing protein n=1 Tax=Periophthalmus magnuspinnatus TaxID=409849 RepID=A0A3B4A740_9GOBI